MTDPRTAPTAPTTSDRATRSPAPGSRAHPGASPAQPGTSPLDEVRTGRIPVTDVEPVVDGGDFSARAVVGQEVRVTATVFREGHDAVAASVALTAPDGAVTRTRMRRFGAQPDRWEAVVVPTGTGLWSYTVEGWSDPYATWAHEAEVKIPLESDVDLVCEEGARLLERCREAVGASGHPLLADAVAALRDTSLDGTQRTAPALSAPVHALLDEHPLRELVSPTRPYEIWVDRERALFGSWYELFPRSEGADVEADPPRSGTFRTAMERLPAVAAMNFDVVYLPPIHPIGRSFRKGPNNTLTPGQHDPGSPWAIGSAEGGHDAIHPELGTVEDFAAFVARTRELGMEVALDLALQAAPDHPWATEHPEWFTERADGTIAYAENPPKKYQDIYPINFDRDPEGIYAEVLRVVLVWVERGVEIFRVDNPHTKPVRFWEWLIREVKQRHPDVLFLAEAFTRPAMMHTLAKIGFTQSYTYFTWRTAKWEIEEYLAEVSGPASKYMRPNFFVNTPDILHASLQYGGPPMFKIRAVLAATASPTWGVYAGYELYEHTAVRAGSEEYLDSEKYQLRPRDWARAEREGRSLAPFLTTLNRLRREHPALQRLANLTLHAVDGDHVLAWSKSAPRPGGGTDTVIVVLTVDSHNTQETTVHLDLPAMGLGWEDRVRVRDELTGEVFEWGAHNYVRLDPWHEPAHILTVLEETP